MENHNIEIKINIVELASELAHNRTLYESGDICSNEDDMFKQNEENEDADDTLYYTDEIQERFNYWYDVYYDVISKCKIK